MSHEGPRRGGIIVYTCSNKSNAWKRYWALYFLGRHEGAFALWPGGCCLLVD